MRFRPKSSHVSESSMIRRGIGPLEALRQSARLVVRFLLPGKGLPCADVIARVHSSALFDRQWYLHSNPDVARARVDPLRHYLTIGWLEGRDPGPQFATTAYLEANPDVAASGMNPLIHFVEFGHSEGRECFAGAQWKAKRGAVAFAFDPPHPCASFTVARTAAVDWLQASSLDGSRCDAVWAGSTVVGYGEPPTQEAVADAFALLGELSAARKERAVGSALPRSSEQLLDAWFINSATLRTRWADIALPMVVRAYQYTPCAGEQLSMIGEALVASPLDYVDLALINRYWPILVAFAGPDGNLRGVRLLAFPSLCRGGDHYPELLYASNERPSPQELDILGASDRLAERLLSIRRAERAPVVGTIEVEVTGASGTCPMFQPDFKLWLANVASVSVEPVGGCVDYVAGAALTPASGDRGDRGSTLLINHDMVPTIGALTELSRKQRDAGAVALPLIVAGAEPAQPATLVRVPPDSPKRRGMRRYGPVESWPRLSEKAPATFPPAAIKLPLGRVLTDAELCFPFAHSPIGLDPGQRPVITWMVDASDWDEGALKKAIHALSRQRGIGTDAVCLLGAANHFATDDALVASAANYTRLEDAIAAVDTPLAAYLAPGIFLHDPRTGDLLANLLDDDRVLTATCLLVSAHRSGKAWHVSVRDAGAVEASGDNSRELIRRAVCGGTLWRTDYPVGAPCSGFWVARASRVKDWIAGAAERQEGFHVCSTVVAATATREATSAPLPSFIPQVPAGKVTKVEALFG